MRKRKIYEISVIDKTYSKIISDETKFYTSDTALELGFELKETEYNFESAEIVLLNTDDRSIVTRPVAKVLDSFAYELDDDIIAHYGEWHGQLRFEQAGEIYVSSPVKFRIENDLSSDRPPQLSDVQSWVSLKRYADKLTDDLKQAVVEVEGMDDTFRENELERQATFEKAETEREKGESVRVETFKTNETERQSQFDSAEQSRQDTFEDAESERAETFESNETTRQTQELEREKAETNRQSEFDDNEAGRFETFNANESTRQENESARKQAENQRQSIFETNEGERQVTFETAEQERQSAELIRVENEKQRNLTSVDEFVKLQDSVGGKNLLTDSDFENSDGGWSVFYGDDVKLENSTLSFNARGTNVGSTRIDKTISGLLKGETYTLTGKIKSSTEIQFRGFSGATIGDTNVIETDGDWVTTSSRFTVLEGVNDVTIRIYLKDGSLGQSFSIDWVKLEKGTGFTQYTKAPEDYAVVSKDDYYNHIKMMSDHRDKQLVELKTAITALGGA